MKVNFNFTILSGLGGILIFNIIFNNKRDNTEFRNINNYQQLLTIPVQKKQIHFF